MKKKAIPPFTLTAGQSGRLLFDFTLPPGAETPALRGALMVHGERVDMEGTQEDMLVIPALPAGVYLAEVRAAGMCVLYGHVEVLPSPLSGEEGLATYRVDVDNTTDVLQVNIAMLEGLTGPQGLSAYDVARQNGFVGTESEWLESLKKDTAVYAAQVVESYLGQARQAAADALNAQGVAEAAREGAQVAQGVAEAAREGAQVAQAGAEAAQVAADDAAGVAAGSAEAAVEAAAEAKAAEAGAAGAADAVRFDLLPITLDWLDKTLTASLGEGNFTMTLNDDETALTVAVSLDTTAAQIAEVESLLDRVLPRNLVTEIDEMPLGFSRLEYLEVSPYQYVDTGVIMTKDIGMKSNHRTLELNGRFVFGVGTIQNGTYCTHAEPYKKDQHHLIAYGWGGNKYPMIYMSVTTDAIQYTELNWLNDGKWKIYLSHTEETYQGDIVDKEVAEHLPLNIFLFALNNSGKPEVIPNAGKKHIWYSANISSGETVICNFIPVLNTVTREPGVFDTVNRVFKTNLGSGDFTYPGAETQSTTYSLRNRMYGKITDHGIRRLYCVPEGYSSKEEYAEANGFKLLVETPMPEEGYWQPVWRETEEELVLEWEEVDSPAGGDS